MDVMTKHVRVEVSEDAYQAHLVVEDQDVQYSEIQAALEANDIAYGLNSASVQEAIDNIGTSVLVASGVKHIDGVDGYFERIRIRDERPSEIKFGIVNIYGGEPIGVIHKPTPGTIGVDVHGKKIEPRPGKQINILTGANIKRTETGDSILLEAKADGNLKISPTAIDVMTEHVIRQDIDYSDGEIEFAGSLRITGDVKGSCSLKIKHDLVILGSVEDAKIICDGNVSVKGSFVGRGDGLIRAKGNVELHVVLNQMIESGSSITVTKECVNAHLIAAESISAKTAIIMGGVVAAGDRIEVRTLGGELYSTTRVRLGAGELLTEEAAAVDKEIEIQTKATEEMKNAIYLLVRERLEGTNFTAEKNAELKQRQAKLQELNDKIKSLNEKKQATASQINRKKCPKLSVFGTVHQSVVIEINGVRHAVKQAHSNVTFEESKNEIIHTRNL